MKSYSFLLAILFLVSLNLYSHEGDMNGEEYQSKALRTVILEIKKDYLENIKPIFKIKCFDCHSNQTQFPWYYKIPVVKQIMDYHIAEGREHLELTNNYPFGGHGDYKSDLKDIKEVVEDDDMPPFYYKFSHAGSALTEDDKKKIILWVDQGLDKINKISENEK